MFGPMRAKKAGVPTMSKDPSCWLHELAWPEVEAHLKGSDLALVPIGATEQHGPHLPLLVDSGWAIAAAEGAALKAGVLAAPRSMSAGRPTIWDFPDPSPFGRRPSPR
jgi:creatinine amidohydrolase/Fe(II)-dependent formamide hydrolase-like protein